MTLLVSLVSILVITQIVWAVKTFLQRKGKKLSIWFCPICIGVSVTWLTLLAAYFAGYSVDVTFLGIMMGGSVVGISYRVDKILPPSRELLWWRFTFIPLGFAAVYLLLNEAWLACGVSVVGVIILSVLLLKKKSLPVHPHRVPETEAVKTLEEQMEQCC